MISAILFDKDGCLIDFDKTWGTWADSLLSDLAEGDESLMNEMAGAIGFRRSALSFEPDSPVIAGTSEEGPDLILPFLPNWTRDALMTFANKRAAEAELFPVVPLAPLMDELRGMGAALGIATNDAEATARAHAKTLGIADKFDMILGSDSGYGGKPEPGMQTAFLAKVGVAAEACIMVGDSLHDLHAGRAAGMVCVGVLTGPAGRDELEPHADVVLPDIGHLPRWIRERAENDA